MQQIIADADDDIRLDRWFKRHLPLVAHSLLSKELRKGGIRVDGQKADAGTRVRSGQELKFPDMFLKLTEPDAKSTKRVKGSNISPNAVKDRSRTSGVFSAVPPLTKREACTKS